LATNNLIALGQCVRTSGNHFENLILLIQKRTFLDAFSKLDFASTPTVIRIISAL